MPGEGETCLGKEIKKLLPRRKRKSGFCPQNIEGGDMERGDALILMNIELRKAVVLLAG